MKQYYVYIMASKKHGAIYTGVTNDLVRRVYEHREGIIEGFTKIYNVKKLVYFEIHSGVVEAITREKVIKGWLRIKKIKLIESKNRYWKDLYGSLF